MPAEPLAVVNPRTGEVDVHVTPTMVADVGAIADELRAAQTRWRLLGLDGRIAAMRAWASSLEEHAAAIGEAECLDTGRRRVSLDQPRLIADTIRGWCDKAPAIISGALREGRSTVDPKVGYRTQLVPYPLVGIISPWNNPCFLSTIDAVPALIAGSALIIKPSEVTPRFVAPMMRSIADVPELAKVLTYVVGGPDVGQALVEEVDLVCFTGSIATGRKIAEACARRIIPCFLEMGGKDAAIVTASANIDRAATAVLKGGVLNTGQLCFGTERVYVDRTIIDDFVAALATKAAAIKPNFPDIGQGHLPPFTLPCQADTVDAQLRDALEKGAKIVIGGFSETLGGGRYIPATIVTDVTHDMQIMRDETFGPVIPVMGYESIDEAVALANDSDYGLSGAVIAGSIEEAEAIGEQLDAGAISLQDTVLTTSIMQDAEKFAFNKSGLGGSRMGPSAILRFFRKKAMIRQEGSIMSMDRLGEEA